MAPITAIIDKTTPNDKVIKLYYSTEKAQLGLALWSGTNDDDPEDPIQTPKDVGNGQYILNPSQMACANFQNVERVFALTTENPFKVTPEDWYTLCDVSPSYQSRGTIAIGNTTLASCASDDDAWIYYSIPGSSRTRSLLELNIRTSRVTSLPFTTDLWINSSAAAWYDTTTKKRSIIYEGGSLVEYCVDDATWGTPIAATGDMQRNTPVAVAFNNNNGTVYLYYCGRFAAGGIRRSTKTNNDWSAPVTLTGPSIAQNSQLTVVRANGINHLFYMARDQNEEVDDYFVHYRDGIN